MATTLLRSTLLLLCWTAAVLSCPDGWTLHGESCYVHLEDRYTWFNARAACQTIHGILVEINSAAENEFISEMISNNGGQNTAIGLEDIAREGTWVFPSNQQAPTETFWARTEPQNLNGREDCGMMEATGLWRDYNCQDANLRSICEQPAPESDIVG